MKQVKMYEIKSYTGNEYSKSLSSKLKTKVRATKLVKYLKKRGISAFAAPMMINV